MLVPFAAPRNSGFVGTDVLVLKGGAHPRQRFDPDP